MRRRRLVDDATQTLRDAILTGRFPAGARLEQAAAMLEVIPRFHEQNLSAFEAGHTLPLAGVPA